MSYAIASWILSNALTAHLTPPNGERHRQPEQPIWPNENKGGVVFGEWLPRILGHHGRHQDMTMADARLERMQHRLREVEARLRLLEMQADLRGYTDD